MVDYTALSHRIAALCEHETDEIALMATIACEVHHSDDRFDWTGFYRVTEPQMLKIGPYQGGHGCLTITYDRGICGAAARTGKSQIVPNVHERPEHIACSSTTNSEIVIPVKNSNGDVVAVLDLDSDEFDAFSENDISLAQDICEWLGVTYHSND